MLKFFNLYILLFSVFLSKSSSDDTTQWIKAGGYLYKFHTDEKNWHAAKKVCTLEGGSLFYPENKDEADAVISLWKNYIKTRPAITWVFLGINNFVDQSVFVTIDDRPIKEVYVNWRIGEPNNWGGHENCVQMNQEGFYNDWECVKKGKFFCKKNAVTSLPPARNFSTTTSCNTIPADTSVSVTMLMVWPNATVPFFINRDHFDNEQATVILKSLNMFEFNTCIKFAPLMSAPVEGQHVMTFINPEGIRRCKIEPKGHSNYNPHLVLVGYECLNTPELDMVIMKALGLPFEHNRPSRNIFIDVFIENIEPSYVQLFTRDGTLPKEFRNIPYDPNSIMHFGERDYSKNGHRAIRFKSRNFRQHKDGLTHSDIKKIALIYGSQCRERDRAEKIAICRTYPRVLKRRKREIIEAPANKISLRVNPHITPLPQMKPNRRRREATDTVPTLKSTEEIKEKKEQKPKEIKNEGKKKNNFKEKVQAMKKERLKEIKKIDFIKKSEILTSVTDSKVKVEKNEKEPPRRKFSEKRFKVQQSRNTSEESDASLEINVEPQNELITQALLKKVLNLGTGTIFDTKKAKEESIEEINIFEKEENTAESSAESTSTNKDHEATEEEGETAVTTTTKKYKKIDKPSLEEVESAEVEQKPIKRIKLKSKRMQKRKKLPKTVELNKLNKDFYTERKWPFGDVIYVIAKLPDYDLEDLRVRLAAVNSILLEKTCVKLREVDAKEAPGFDDYVILDNSQDYVTGRVGGKQNFGCIELFEGGYHKQHTAMVVMAMLGFYFEVSRHDRDKHIVVHNRHIRADKLHHFEKIHKEATLDLPYDYKSATHPAWQFWRRVGKKGISTVATYKEQDPDGSVMRALGQNPELLSETDIIKINSVYGVECFKSNRAKKKSVRMLRRKR